MSPKPVGKSTKIGKSRSVTSAVLKRIQVHGRGWVFTPQDFVDIGSRAAVDKSLSRLSTEQAIRRLAQGLYDYPRLHRKLGPLAPDPDRVASALAAKAGSRVQISGARAANLLGLSDQVPAQIVYLTNGPARRVRIGAQTIQLKRAASSLFPAAGTSAGLALQAIRALDSRTDQDFVVNQLARVLDAENRKRLVKLSKYAPGWSREIFKRLKEFHE